MPEDISLQTLSWHDVFLRAHDELGRTPTRQEVLGMWDEIRDKMTDAAGDDFSAVLSAVLEDVIPGMMQRKQYSQDAMSKEELTSRKHCHRCQEMQDTYWELSYCNRNPHGLYAENPNHGNDNTCEDGYCSPESGTVERQDIDEEYVKKHTVSERCMECHQHFESAGPRK